MAGHSHLIDFPEALEAFFSRVGELAAAVGPKGSDGVKQVEALIAAGLAARERGDRLTAISSIVQAMERLAEVASASGSPEGAMLRQMAARFREAMTHQDLSQAKDAAETMRVASGSTITPRKGR
jgi:hypothetical protein